MKAQLFGTYCLASLIATIVCAPLLTASGSAAAESSAHTPRQPVILFIGDSHSVELFGMQQDYLLRKIKGFRVATYSICGSTPLSWMLGEQKNCGYFFRETDGKEQRGWEIAAPTLPGLIAAHQPSYTVVELGANMYGHPPEWIEKTAHEMAMTIVNSGSKCIWIGPPQARNQPEPELGRVFAALQAGIGQYCLLFDSRNATSYPASGGDGIHFGSLGEPGQQIAINWALAAFYAFSPVIKLPQPAKQMKAHCNEPVCPD